MYKIILALLFCTVVSFGQSMEVPVSVQAALFHKIAGYDRNLVSKAPGDITVGVAFQKKNKTSQDVKEQFIKALKDKSKEKISGKNLRCLPLDLSSPDFASSLKGINILYITPLRAYDVNELTASTRENKISTFTGVEEYLKNGVSTCIASKGGKPIIKISLPSAKAEGVDYKSALLKIAEVIQ